MTAVNPKAHVLITSIPRGFGAGNTLRVGIRLSIRLSYDDSSTNVTLADFPDFLEWPMGGLAWEATFDNGATWVPAVNETWGSDQGFWAAAFHRDVWVKKQPVEKVPVARSVLGYSMRALAVELQEYHTSNRLTDSLLGRSLVPRIFPRVVLPPSPSSAETTALDGELTRFFDFYRTSQPRTDAIKPTRLGGRDRPTDPGRDEPDFHQRMSLVSDHGPLLERLGLALELEFPARSGAINRMSVRAIPESGAPPAAPIVFGGVSTNVRYTPGSLFAAASTSPILDDRLRLRLNDESLFDIHSIDVDASLISAYGLPDFRSVEDAPPPPPPQTTGFTIALDDTAGRLSTRLAASRAARSSLKSGGRPIVGADSLVQGYLIEVQRQVPPSIPPLPWRSLCHRSVTYTAFAENGEERRFTAISEAPVGTGLRMRDGSNNLETSDVLARWDGWSLAVERPGRYQLQEDATTGGVVDTPGVFPGGTLDIAASLSPLSAHRLPVLRFGSRYKFRARAVDVTGFAHPWDASAGDVASAATPYLRYDPVSAPLVLSTPVPTRTETALRLVVRSDPRTGELPTVSASRTIVPPRGSVETALTHGMFDKGGAPDPAQWDLIADMDDRVPPKDGPPPLDAAGTPAGMVVDWLPDPMCTEIGARVGSSAMKKVSFRPPGSDVLGKAALGRWQSIAVRLSGVTTGTDATMGSVIEASGHRIIPVSIPPGFTRTLKLRGLPPQSRLPEHGLYKWIEPENPLVQIYEEGWDRMCPPVEVTLVHAVRKPIEDPARSATPLDYVRYQGMKDPRIVAQIVHHPMSTGRLTVYATWSQWRDEGGYPLSHPLHRPPARVDVRDTVIADKATDTTPLSGKRTQTVVGVLVASDLRRIDVTLRAVATSRFVEEFREALGLTWSTVVGIDGPVLDLPSDVDLESIRLLRENRDLVIVDDYRVVVDPRTGRRTFALNAGIVPAAVAVLGVRGPVTAGGALGTVVVPAAMRPLPPQVAYVVPAFTYGSPLTVAGKVSTSRGAPRVRIWLERPWWSSGDHEKLAVVWWMDPRPDGGSTYQDDDVRSKLVTLLAKDPLHAERREDEWMIEPTTGQAYGPVSLDDAVPSIPAVSLKLRLHDVQYDEDRDLYYTDVAWPEQVGNRFVRMAVARFQEHVAEDLSQLSLIKTIDPIRLLPARRAEAWTSTSSGQIVVKVTGQVRNSNLTAELPRLRVSFQRKRVAGESELGWDTESFKEVVAPAALEPVYPLVSMARPTSSGEHRILVEELEPQKSYNIAGLPAQHQYVAVPKTTGEAVGEFTGRRAVWVATMPLPPVA